MNFERKHILKISLTCAVLISFAPLVLAEGGAAGATSIYSQDKINQNASSLAGISGVNCDYVTKNIQGFEDILNGVYAGGGGTRYDFLNALAVYQKVYVDIGCGPTAPGRVVTPAQQEAVQKTQTVTNTAAPALNGANSNPVRVTQNPTSNTKALHSAAPLASSGPEAWVAGICVIAAMGCTLWRSRRMGRQN